MARSRTASGLRSGGRSPALACLALHAAALWPQACWVVSRLRDGSDDPLGVVATVTLLLLVARQAAGLRRAPRPAWLLLATLLLSGAAITHISHLPQLLSALLGTLSLVAALAAWLPQGIARAPLAGLAVLALPLISSLQFYAGYPLRIVTAQVSAWILDAMGVAAARSGASMTVHGQLVIVDAPCSGVQLAWMAYFTACTLAALRGLDDRRFLSRLPLVGGLVIAGNIVRNLVLVLLEVRPGGLDDASHEAIGLVVLAAICGLVLRSMRAKAGAPRVSMSSIPDPAGGSRWTWMAALAPVLIAGAMFLVVPVRAPEPEHHGAKASAVTEWPRSWNGVALRPLALSAVERRFAERFPGRIGRFSAGEQTLVLREIEEPTRRLHPAVDCYRGLGYDVGKPVLERDGEQRLWRCFLAGRDGRRQRVCEQIVDAKGQTFTDTSAWYWSALLGQSTGPWQAVTRAQAH